MCAVSEAGPGPLTSADLAAYYGAPPDLRERDLGPPPGLTDGRKLATIRDYSEYPEYPGSGGYTGHTMLAMEPDLKSSVAKDPYDRYAMPPSMGGALSQLGSLTGGYPPTSLYSPYSPYSHNPSSHSPTDPYKSHPGQQSPFIGNHGHLLALHNFAD